MFLAALTSCDEEEERQINIIKNILDNPEILRNYYHPDSLYYIKDSNSTDQEKRLEIERLIRAFKYCVHGNYTFNWSKKDLCNYSIYGYYDDISDKKVAGCYTYEFGLGNTKWNYLRVRFVLYNSKWSLISMGLITPNPHVTKRDCFNREFNSITLDSIK